MNTQMLARSQGRLRSSYWRPRTFTDWLFMMVPASAAVGSSFGSIALFGVVLYPFKVIVLLLFIVVISQHRRAPAVGVPIIGAALALAAWALLSVTWSPASSRALQEATIFVFLAVLLVTALKSIGTNWFPSLMVGWPVAVIFTSAVAAWELATGGHLQSEFVTDRDGSVGRVLLSTFGNPNNYGAFLALAAAMSAVLLGSRGQFGRRTRAATAVAILLATALLPLTGSRFAVLGLIAGLLAYGTMTLPARRGQRFVLTFAMIAVPMALVAVHVSPTLATKFSSVGAERGGVGNSTSIRENLILNGWDFFIGSRGTGVGAAGYEALILAGSFRHPLYGRAVNPHNMWIEILSEYGLVGISSIILMLAIALRAASPLRHPSWFGAAYVAAFATYVLAAMTASSYVNDAVSWTFFATFVAAGVWADVLRAKTP